MVRAGARGTRWRSLASPFWEVTAAMRRLSSQRLSELHGLEPGLLLFRVRRCHLSHDADVEVKTFALLKVADDLEQVAGLWVAPGPKHAHKALGRLVGEVA